MKRHAMQVFANHGPWNATAHGLKGLCVGKCLQDGGGVVVLSALEGSQEAVTLVTVMG